MFLQNILAFLAFSDQKLQPISTSKCKNTIKTIDFCKLFWLFWLFRLSRLEFLLLCWVRTLTCDNLPSFSPCPRIHPTCLRPSIEALKWYFESSNMISYKTHPFGKEKMVFRFSGFWGTSNSPFYCPYGEGWQKIGPHREGGGWREALRTLWVRAGRCVRHCNFFLK